MANRNDLVVTAGLNIDASVSQITKDLDEVSKKIPADALKIKCSVDTSNIKAIQNQLKNLSKSLKLDVFSNDSNNTGKNITNDVVKAFNDAFGMVGKMGETTKKEFNAQTKQMLQDFKTAWQNGLTTGDIKPYYEALDKLGERISDFCRGDVKLLKEAIADIRREFTDGSIVSIGSNLKKELDYLTGSDSLTRQKLDALYGSGKYTIGSGNVGYDTLFKKDEEATNAILNAANKILSYQNKIRSVGWGLDELQEIGLSTQEIKNNIEDTLRQIVGLSELPKAGEWVEIDAADDIQEVNQLGEAYERLSEAESDAGEQTEKWRKKQERVQQDYEILAATIKKAKLNIDEIATRDGVNYNQVFNDLMSSDITNAAKLNEAKDAVAAIRKEFRLVNAEMASDIPQNAIEGLVSRIAKADSQIKVLKIDFDKLSQVPDYLQESFDKLKESIKGFDFSSDYQVGSKEELSERVKQYTQIKVALNDTQALLKVAQKEEQTLNSETAKRNKEIQKQINLRQQEIQKIKELNEAEMHNYWQGRFEETIKGMTAENTELKALKEQLLDYNKAAKEAENQQKRTFKNDSQIANLTNQITKFANTNKKAIESMKVMRDGTTFADEWQRIVTTLKSGNLDENAIKQLAQDFKDFKGQAESAGLSVNKLFASMQSQLRLVLQRWISLYAVVKYLRDMVDNVKSLDTAMINLKRVTDATDASYSKFIENAEKQATKLKTTTSSLVEQAYQWAKLGYNMDESLDLANASTIFMRVADVDQTQALSNLVTALKAYRIEAKDTIDVVDKLDKLNNEFAVSAAGLGEGLERSASSLQMTGNSLDQSLALLTGAGEITQNLENTGNALKVVALRLQGMKGKLEELEEPVDDLMEVSKIQTQILNITRNQVNIYDDANGKFRSTYDILKDISEIWDTLSSTDRASLTEIMFGKLRANQGLAIIQAFQSGQIEKAYEASIKAAGTATKENEEMMEGLQAHMDAFKHSFEELSNAVMESDFLKTLIDGGKTFLELLTKIAKAFGTLTLVSTGVGIFAGLKNTNLLNVATMKQATSAFQLYNAQLAIGNKNLATQTILQNTENTSLKSYIVSLNGAKASLGSYTAFLVKTKIETIALRAATIALNAALTFGISAGISLLMTGINNLVHAEEKAAEEEQNLIQKFEDNTKQLEQTESSIDDLITKYSELVLNSKDVASAQKDLSELQTEVAKDYGKEADSIDLVNGKYSEQIQNLYDLKKAKAEAFIYDKDNIKEYENALDKLNNVGDGNGLLDFQFKLVDNKSRDSFEKFINQWKDNDLFVSFKRMVGYGQQVSYGFELANKDALTVYQTLDKMAESYKELSTNAGEFNEKQYELIKQQAVAAKEYYDKYKKIQDYFEKQKEIAGLELSENTKKRYDELITKIKDLYSSFNGSESIEDKFRISQDLENVKKEVYSLINGNEELTVVTNKLFETIDDDLSLSLESVDSLKEAWLKDYEEMEKGSLKTISTMVSALQDLSEGKGIAANTFWSLIEFDEEGLLNGAQLVGDKFVLQQEKMIELKDKYVQKQIDSIRLKQEEISVDKQTAETQVRILQTQKEMWKFSEKPLNNPTYRREYEQLLSKLEEAKKSAKAFGDEWVRNNWLIEYLNQTLGNTIDKEKELEARQKAVNKELTALNKELDNYVKAHEAVIDGVIKKLEAEGDELEAQKQTLEDELDILNEQKDTLEDTIKGYESVNKLVQNTVQKEIDTLKEQKQAIEDTYNARIDALKAENEERSDALEYAEKLANLENAKKNKRRVYDETRGWRYESVKEDVSKAKNDLADFETQQAIKKLEKERDQETDAIDEIVKKKEKYVKSWDELLDSIQSEEDELLAAEILGADWREKITNGDTELMEKFRQEYQKHNTALQTLTKTEIKLKEEEIKAKEAEIDANKKRVESWKNYKNEVSTAVTEIKNANEEYQKQIGTIELDETSSLETRQKAFETFKDKVTGYVDEIAKKEAELETIQNLQDGLGGEINYDVHVAGVEELKKAAAAGAVLAASAGITSFGTGAAYAGIGAAMSIANNTVGQMSNDIVNAVNDIMNRLGFASGGVADYTGLAMLHGRKNAPEVIFNASDSAKLYQLVHGTPNLMADMIDKATKLSQFNMAKVGSTTNTSSVNIDSINVYANNPAELSRGLDKELDRYFQTKLTQNYTSRS